MELVELEKDGSFLVMLPFSLQKTVAFAKIELKNEELSEDESGNVIRYKRINITNNTIDDISKQDYLTERSIIYSSFSSNEGERDAELTPIEDYVMPETPEPGINEGPTEDWFKIDESKEPEIEGFLTKNDPLDKVKSEDINAEKDIVSEKDKNAKKTDVTKPEEKSDKTGN